MQFAERKGFGKTLPEKVRKFIRRERGLGKSHRYRKHVPNGRAIRLDSIDNHFA